MPRSQDAGALLVQLTPEAKGLVEIVEQLLEVAAPGELFVASERLVAVAEGRRSPEYREGLREPLTRANSRHGLLPTAAQLEGQMTAFQDQLLAEVFDAMAYIGGQPTIDYCWTVAQAGEVSLVRRRMAFDVLQIRELDPAKRAALALLHDHLSELEFRARPAPIPGVVGGRVSNASEVLIGLRPSFTACYNTALKQDRTLSGSFTFVARVGSSGNVTSVGATPERPSIFVECIRGHILRAPFAPPEGGSAVISIPMTFVQESDGLRVR